MTSRVFFALLFTLATTACQAEVGQGSGGGGATPGTPGSGGAGGVGGTGSAGGGPAEGGGPPCAVDADCVGGEICVFSIKLACAAQGKCEPKPQGEPCGVLIQETACGCDGHEVKWLSGCQTQVPDGDAPAPIAYFGECGSQPQCTQSSDCTPENGYTPPSGFTHGECAYRQDQGCAARGVCVDPFPQCNSLVDVVGCACDGTEIHMGCGYPSNEYAPKPLAHKGACDGP